MENDELLADIFVHTGSKDEDLPFVEPRFECFSLIPITLYGHEQVENQGFNYLLITFRKKPISSYLSLLFYPSQKLHDRVLRATYFVDPDSDSDLTDPQLRR
jgi:hypothetical protein